MSQPRHGFRAGLDSVLLGAAVGQGRRNLLDLGCGVGTAGLVALAHEPALTAVLADQNIEMLALATSNAAENGFAERVRIIEADVTARGSDRHTAGLADNAFDVVIANPPFFDDHAGTLAADAGRAGARHMDSAALDLWVKTAAGCASGGGEIIFVYPAESLSPLLASFTQRFGAITILPLSPRPDAPVTRVLIRGVKGSRAPLTLLASRPLHGPDGRAFQPDFDAIFRGSARLDW
ncbi:tRNA1(Val) (adenine(37)-N6)-methyltransferase [Devosia sp. SL43]|uniref:tRNA1(Val) (adenine(37)-N6)-methyltransferase n=1 Tax=Devosia sp. SL43 TaxID=2806348 RepID=UPI001F0126E2|nr:methyltransferase [Devosia sp. SL43]UJW85294.1 methyltransferase [Devosia sp. SL43]